MDTFSCPGILMLVVCRPSLNALVSLHFEQIVAYTVLQGCVKLNCVFVQSWSVKC